MKKVELTVTDKGGKIPNKWKSGEKINVHPNIATQLIEKGFAVEGEAPAATAKAKK